jgi:hypothetical protein
MAQQAYPYSPYGSANGPYPGQYAPQSQPYGYGQPQQYAQPQYPQQYGQPQYPQQYGQPQYPQSQQYAQPGYAQPQYDAQQPYPDLGQEEPQQSSAPQQPLDAGQIEQLLAPVALYPDALLAQILAASTYPAQVAVADQWLRQMQAQGYGSPDQIASGADGQSNWDPSVKALTAFPQVLDMMNQNLAWTTQLGNAYYNQPQDVMQTVQVLRQRAQDAGNLQSTPQEDVSDNQGYIELAPPNPQTVYVPQYDPWAVYGQPVAPYPGFSLLGSLGSFVGPAIRYGLGFAMDAFDRTPFGWVGWALNWLTNSVLFQHSNYFSQSTTVADWGLPGGGPRAYSGRGESSRMSYGNSRSQQYGNRSGGNYGRAPAQSYARPGQSFGRPAQQFDRPQQQFDRPNQFYGRPADGYSGARSYQGYNRGYAQPGNSYARPAFPSQQSYNRASPSVARPQTYAYARPNYANPDYGYGGSSRSAQSYGARPNSAYASPYQSYRAPQYGSSRAFAQSPQRGYAGSYSKPGRSGGFHLFGHGRESNGFSGGGRAPKGFSGGGRAPKGFGGGKAPKAGHSGGHGGSHHFR